MMDIDRELFSEFTLFWDVPYDSVRKYLAGCGEIELPANHILLSPGAINHNIYILLSGILNVHLDSMNKQPLLSLSVGECVGEMSIIDHKNPSAYVVVAEPARLLVIGQETIWKLINASHGVASNLLLILSRRLRSGNKIIADSMEIRRQIEEVALIDALTGLHNRRWLDNVMERQLNRSRRDGRPLTFIMADVDHFKPFNDRHGHLAGDLVLTEVAQTMRDLLRPNDMIGRYGGEEFVVLLPDTGIEDGLEVAERLRQGVAAATVKTAEGMELPAVTISLGLAESHPDSTVKDLLAGADRAMYRAKKSGRNQTSS